MRHTEGPATILESDEDVGVQVDLHRDVAWIAHAYFSHLQRASGFRSHYYFLVLDRAVSDVGPIHLVVELFALHDAL